MLVYQRVPGPNYGWKMFGKTIYPLVNVYRNPWKDPTCYYIMGKLTISMAMFNSNMFVISR